MTRWGDGEQVELNSEKHLHFDGMNGREFQLEGTILKGTHEQNKYGMHLESSLEV